MANALWDSREDTAAQSKTTAQYLTFWIANQLYGLPIEQVVQIIGVQTIVPIPEYPAYAKGVVNLRGDIIPVIDVRIRFHFDEMPYDEKTCIIICTLNNMHVGFVVDAVDEVATIPLKDITPSPDLMGESARRFVTGIGKPANKIVLLLSAERIIHEEEVGRLSQ